MSQHLPDPELDAQLTQSPPALLHPDWEEEWSNPDGDIPISPDVRSAIEHPYANYQIIAALAASTPSGLIDDTALSADLVAKRAARGDTTYTFPPAPAATGPLTLIDIGLLVSVATAWPSWVALWLNDSAPAAHAPTIAAWSAIPIACTAAALARAHPNRWPWLRRDDSTYTAAEHTQLQRARADWPGRGQLADYSNAAQLQAQWDRRWPYVDHCGAAAAVWAEPHLVGLAHCIADDIESGKAWNSELFDVHRVRIDLPATLAEIRLRAFRIWRIRADTVKPAGDVDPDGSAIRRYREITDAVTAAENRLVALVDELARYSASLKPIDRLVEELAALSLSSERVSDNAVRQLQIDAAGSEFQLRDIRDARAELVDIEANLTGRLDILHAALHTPDAALPLVATS